LKELTNKPLGQFKITAYDLSIASCGRALGHPSFGKTASGYSLAHQSRTQAMSVAVDTKVIPMGSRLYIEFEEKYSKYTGIYTARDTGSAIKGNIIDIFMGDFRQNNVHPSVMEFGVTSAKVFMLPKDFK